MSITVSHSGKQHSYHTARSLLRLGQLDRFYTSSYVTQPWLQQYFTRTENTFFTRRFLPELAAPHVHADWLLELKETIYRKRYGKDARTQEAVYQRDVKHDAFVASQMAERPSKSFWGFQGSCHASLMAAKAAGKTAICELATAHVVESKRILGEEQSLHPEWADSLDNLVFPAYYEKRLTEEPHLADYAVSASGFTTQTLLADGIAPEKIIYLPLGFDLEHIPYTPRLQDNYDSRPLRLLYVGTVTQRKGMKYLLEALKNLNAKKDIELTVIGGIQGSGQAFKQYEDWYSYQSPVAQHIMFQQYAQYDALVLPTVFEGFGLVIVEAMAAGLPVITTPHSMGPEVIEHKKNGYIVPIRDISSLEAAITHLRSLSTHDYLAMRAAARESVLAFTWQAFAQKMSKVIHQYQL